MSRKNRSYSLIFGRPIILDDDYFIAADARGSNQLLNLEAFYDEGSPDAYLIDKHEMSFKVTKSIKANNKAEVTVEQLSPATINYLLANRNRYLTVILKVGYDGDNKILFQGTMKDCYVTKTGQTSKTKIIIDDGSINTKNAYSSKTYPVGTKVQRIVEELILDMATPAGTVIDLPPDTVTSTPFSIYGNSFDKLNRLLEGYGYEPTINGGYCYIMPRGRRLATNSAFISKESGLIGEVQGLDLSAKPKNLTDTTDSDKKHIRFTCQMDATLNPMSSVYVTDPENEIDGAFKIEKVVFLSSSFETGSWFVTVDAIEIDATVVV